ncbi:MAG: CPBP family intramembrane metalloprotease [Verrucomicrobiales bacterium]|nr:CPBP family intramembrane metalloprotease [Verrucomicrobiales bacterium]
MSDSDCLPLTGPRIALLTLFAIATVCLIPLHWHFAGGAAWIACLILLARDSDRKLRLRIGVLLGCIAILGAADINSSTSNANFLRVGIPFTLVILLPAIILGKWDSGTIRYRFWPKKWRKADIFYTILSIPLSWAVLKFYWLATPEQFAQWTLPPEPDDGEIKRLFIGINMVGIWDELFFINTVFAILRRSFSFPVANLVQAVVYTSVLNDMAFIGIGPVIILIFAWTQGSMFEKSESLLWVLIVHLIVDFFLVAAIVQSYYPAYGLDYLWRHGF